MADLAALIRDRMGDRSLEQLRVDCGGVPSKSRLAQILNDRLANFPDPATINGLSVGLKVSVTTIVYAAAESLGLDMSRRLPRLAEVLPQGADRLTDVQVESIVAVVAAMIDPSRAAKGPAKKLSEPSDNVRPLPQKEAPARKAARGEDKSDPVRRN